MLKEVKISVLMAVYNTTFFLIKRAKLIMFGNLLKAKCLQKSSSLALLPRTLRAARQLAAHARFAGNNGFMPTFSPGYDANRLQPVGARIHR